MEKKGNDAFFCDGKAVIKHQVTKPFETMEIGGSF